jgi:hypothetical protein
MSEQMREKLYAAWKEAGWDDEYFAIGESMWNAAIAALSQPAAADVMLQALKTTAGNIRSLGPAGAIPEPYKVWLDVVENAIAKATP